MSFLSARSRISVLKLQNVRLIQTKSAPNLGFIGLGRMGYPMALNVLRNSDAGSKLTVFDVSSDAVARFKEERINGKSAEVASSPEEVAAASDLIVTMLPENSHVQGVYNQIMEKLDSLRQKSPKLFIDSSTIDPFVSIDIGKKVAATSSEWKFVDAPVSGGVVGAAAGTLTFMLGAPQELIAECEATVLMMGKKMFHCGPAGAGLAAKLANNYLLAINNVGTCEALNLGIKLGLDPKVLTDIINVSTGRCWPSEINNPVLGCVKGAPVERDYVGGFGVRLMRKDLKLATAAGKKAGAAFQLSKAAEGIYDKAADDQALGPKDFSIVYKLLESASG